MMVGCLRVHAYVYNQFVSGKWHMCREECNSAYPKHSGVFKVQLSCTLVTSFTTRPALPSVHAQHLPSVYARLAITYHTIAHAPNTSPQHTPNASYSDTWHLPKETLTTLPHNSNDVMGVSPVGAAYLEAVWPQPSGLACTRLTSYQSGTGVLMDAQWGSSSSDP